MAQLFHPAFNPLSKASIFGGVFVVAAIVWVSGRLYRSPYVTEAFVAREQPVAFSHQHHAGTLGIDCRYCHTTVEDDAFAGIPPGQTCMNCHSQIWAGSPVLEPVRRSVKESTPIRWNRVHRLPDYVYFDHSIHVAKGVGCVRCHGRVDEMPLVYRQETLYMEWCLDCHRHPERAAGPRDKVFDLSWSPEGDAAPAQTVAARTDCVDCHR